MKEFEVLELQQTRFEEQIQEILKEGEFRASLICVNGVVKGAKINTNCTLNQGQLEHLLYLKRSWNFNEIELSRSGAGIRIVYKGGKPINQN